MSLGQFLADFGINTKSLEGIKKRVYVVGKYNTSLPGATEFLFSKNSNPDERFINDAGELRIGNLSYSSFIKKIGPQLSEIFSEVRTHKGDVLPYFVLSPHMDLEKSSTSYVIDNYNYFDVRASSNSEQPYFKELTPNVDIKDFLEARRFAGKEELPGKEIFKQIRENLNKFCSFQNRNFQLIQAFTLILSKFAGRNGVPAGINKDSELPVNFLPVFIDFLYQEKPLDESFNQKLALIDFNSDVVWAAGVTDKNKDAFFGFLIKLFTVYKNYLVNPASINNEVLPGLAIKSLLNEQSGVVSEELRKKFVNALDAYNMLTQIIQSKVLLSMVLRWAVSYFENEIQQVKGIKDTNEKNAEIEDAILNGKFGLVKPSGDLPPGYTTTTLIDDFKRDFRLLMEYVNNPNSERSNQIFQQFNPVMQSIALSLCNDEQKRNTIQRMMAMAPEQKEIMFRALLNLFTDVLLPRLFKSPGLTEDGLIKKFKEYEMDLFFTSSMMDIVNGSNMDKIIDNEMDKTEGQTRESIAGNIINVFVGILMEPEVQRKVEEARVVLDNVQVLRGLIPSVTNSGENSAIGIGSITSIGSSRPMLEPGEAPIYKTDAKRQLISHCCPTKK